MKTCFHTYFLRSQPAFGCQPAFRSSTGRPLFHVFFTFSQAFSPFFPCVTEEYVKNAKKMILTTKWQPKHLFSGQNTQQKTPRLINENKKLLELKRTTLT